MKLNKITRQLTLLGLPALSLFSASDAYAWYCTQGVITPQVFSQIQSEFQTTTAGLGNLQMSINATQLAINTRLNLMDQQLQKQVDAGTVNQENALKSAAQKIMNAVESMGAGQIQANTAISSRKVQKMHQKEVNKLADSFEQPITNCMQYSAGKNLFNTTQKMARTSNQAALQISRNALAVKEPRAARKATYDELNESYINTNSSLLKDADVNAALVFGGSDGSYTRATVEEDKAAETFKSHIVGEIYAPPALDFQEKTSSGQIYTNLQRRIATYFGLVAKSIGDVMENHRADVDLVDFYTSAGLSISEQQKQNGVSYSEVLNTYADKMISGNVLKSISSTGEPKVILRQLNQNMSFKLLVAYRKAQSLERQVVLDAAKLSLLAEKVLGDQSSYLRQDAINQINSGSGAGSGSGSFRIDNVVDGTSGSSGSITVPNP